MLSRDGVADVDVRDARSEAVDELDRVSAGGDDVAEVHDDADVVGQAVGQQLCALEVPAQPVEVQRLGPQLDAVGRP